MTEGIFIFSSFIILAACANTGKNNSTDKLNSNATQVDIYSNAPGTGKTPTLQPAKIGVKHVDDQIKDGVFIPAHLEYEIAEPAHWERIR